jgi:hypothetical protein
MQGSASIWFLGVIAVASLVQAGFLVALAVGGLRLFRKVDELQTRLDREIRPALDGINRLTRNAAEISDLTTLQVRRLDYFVADSLDKLEDVTSSLRGFVVRPLRPLGDLAAFVRGLRRGLDVYRQLGGFERRRRVAPPRRPHADDDEHLFI